MKPKIHFSFFLKIVFYFTTLALLILVGLRTLPEKEGFITNLYTEIVSFIYTSFLVAEIIDWSAKKRARIELREKLLREAGSSVNSIAKNAIDQLRKLEWLKSEKSLLVSADLFSANLEGANLSFSNLSKSKLTNAILKHANLSWANLESAYLEKANLENADIEGANFSMAQCIGCNFINADLKVIQMSDAVLRESNLSKAALTRSNLRKCDLTFAIMKNTTLLKADLTEAELPYANICGADLTEARLKGANIYNIKYDSKTIFPDGRKYYKNKTNQIARNYGAKLMKPFWE